MVTRKAAGMVVAGLAGLLAAGAWAQSTAMINACVSLKDGTLRVVASGQACGKNEQPLQWNVAGPKGDPGTPGTPGAPGAALGTLTGIGCNTETHPAPMPPDGHISPVTLLHGMMSLTCVSDIPVLTIAIQPSSHCLPTYGGGSICQGVYGSVEQIDDTGAPLPNGFGCADDLAEFAAISQCSTDIFTVGMTVRFRAVPPAPVSTPFPPPAGGFGTAWISGCDTVDGDVCTVTLKPGPQAIAEAVLPGSF